MATESNGQATTPNTGTLLLRAFQRFQQELMAGLEAEGHSIRSKHGAVLANVDADGTRLTELARRAGMGKPALGELVDELESLGLVERVPDPTDGRAKLVVPTPAGVRAIEAARRLIGAIESGYRQVLGEATYRTMREALVGLVPQDEDDIQPRL